VLVTQDNQIKICDFGLATICAPGTTITDGRVVGKEKYMCPELYYGEEYDARLVDIWSAGVIFFLMLTSVFPYERPSAEDPRLVMLCHGKINELLAHWKRATLDEEIVQVFSKMFCTPQERWHAQQLLQLPFCQRFANVQKATVANALGQAPVNVDVGADAMSEHQDSIPMPCASTDSDAKSSMDSPASQECSLSPSVSLSTPRSHSHSRSPSQSSAASRFPSVAGSRSPPYVNVGRRFSVFAKEHSPFLQRERSLQLQQQADEMDMQCQSSEAVSPCH